MFGFGKKKRTRNVSVPKFGFDTLPPPVPPSLATADILSKQNRIRVLCGTLIAGTIAALYLAYSVEAVATTEPYVADGGVFGCPVPVLKARGK